MLPEELDEGQGLGADTTPKQCWICLLNLSRYFEYLSLIEELSIILLLVEESELSKHIICLGKVSLVESTAHMSVAFDGGM